MNKNIRLWIDTLRSGVFPDGTKFKQGRGTLRPKENSYCCLGVACELYRQKTGKGEWNENRSGDRYAYFQASLNAMPSGAHRFFGGKKINQDLLAAMNDGNEYFHDGAKQKYRKQSFAQIAQYLEDTFIKAKPRSGNK